MRILIIDDSKLIQAMVVEMLHVSDFETVSAYNGKMALDILDQGETFDLILLDWNMPEVNGPEFLRQYKDKKYSASPVVMMTTENKNDKISLALSLGAKEYIMKPFTSDILLSKIDMVIKH